MNKQDLEELQELLDMEVEEEATQSRFDIAGLLKSLWTKRKYFYISLPIAAIVAVVLSLDMPKYYVVNVKLAPELSGSASSAGGLTSIMKNLTGGRLNSGQESDAILPNLYPDLMNSQAFLVSLFDIPVESKDGKIKTTYYEYLSKHQKTAWWTKAMGFAHSLIPSFGGEEKDAKQAEKDNQMEDNGLQSVTNKSTKTLALSKRQAAIAKAIAGNVVCDVDKKTYVISISVNAQDPVICATVADSACQRLQEFITDYRTKKAKVEYDHIVEQYNVAKAEYEEAKERVAAYNDANWDLVEEEFVVEKQALQNEMQLRFSAFSTINTQLIASRAKLDEARPIFTVLDGATVPLRPAGPSKKKFVLGIVLMVGFVQALWILRKELSKKKEENQAA